MLLIILAMLLSFALPAAAQQEGEKPVDPSSVRVSVLGCLRGRNLMTIDPVERPGEPVNASVGAGRVFRLSGSKQVMKDLGKRDRTAVEVTGLVRRAAIDGSTQGIPIGAGGRVRIGGMSPVSSDPTRGAGRDPVANVPVLDVESFRPADAVCPAK